VLKRRNVTRSAALRIALADKLREWGVAEGYAGPRSSYELISKIFKKDVNYYDPDKHWSDEDDQKCEALLGPHGYALFKMWEAQHGK
jgi:hypothetical protein